MNKQMTATQAMQQVDLIKRNCRSMALSIISPLQYKEEMVMAVAEAFEGLINKSNELEEQNRKLIFMISNGLGPDDLKGSDRIDIE